MEQNKTKEKKDKTSERKNETCKRAKTTTNHKTNDTDDGRAIVNMKPHEKA